MQWLILLLTQLVMTMTEVIKEYAEAIFTLACEMEKEEEIAGNLTEISHVFSENPELLSLLVCPGISVEERCDVIEKIFASVSDASVVSLLGLLCEKGRIGEFQGCYDEYMRLLGVRRNKTGARVVSAVELNDTELAALREKLEKISGKTVEIEASVDAELLGGLTVEMDGKLIDGSLKTKLRDVKEVMSK